MKKFVLFVSASVLAVSTLFYACTSQHKVDSEVAPVKSNERKFSAAREELFLITQTEINDILADTAMNEDFNIFALIDEAVELEKLQNGDYLGKQIAEPTVAKQEVCRGKPSYSLAKCALQAIDKYGCIQVVKDKKTGDYVVYLCDNT
jgi:hypothetical protein